MVDIEAPLNMPQASFRGDVRQMARSDARVSLQSVSHSAAPTGTSANLARTVPLYTSTPEEDAPDALLDGMTPH